MSVASWVTMSLATVSAVVNAYVAHTASKRLTPFAKAWTAVYTVIAALSVFYVGAFIVLATTDVDRASWSEVLTPVSAVSFFVVWIVPAVVARLEHLALRDLLKQR